jgi:hypothetical protein
MRGCSVELLREPLRWRLTGCLRQPVASVEFLPCRDVAQPGRALAWGARGRQFKSARPDHYFLFLSLRSQTALVPWTCRVRSCSCKALRCLSGRSAHCPNQEVRSRSSAETGPFFMFSGFTFSARIRGRRGIRGHRDGAGAFRERSRACRWAGM